MPGHSLHQRVNSDFPSGAGHDQGLELKEVFFIASREVKKSTGQTPWISLEASLEPYYLLASQTGAETHRDTQSNPQSPPAPPEAQPSLPQTDSLPAEGFFGLADLFNGTAYDLFDDWNKQQLLREAQEKLRNAGKYKSSIDGLPGLGTHDAILAFQQEQGLPSTGQLDQATLKALSMEGKSERSRPDNPSPAPRPKPSQSPRPTDGDGGLSPEERVKRALGL